MTWRMKEDDTITVMSEFTYDSFYIRKNTVMFGFLLDSSQREKNLVA